MSLSGSYAADGSLRVTVVDGSSRVSTRAADGSLNVILSDGSLGGIYHSCGALRVTPYTTGLKTFYATDGSILISESLTTDTTRVTIVTGVLSNFELREDNTVELREDNTYELRETPATNYFLLLETGNNLLLETGDKLILEGL